MTRKAGSFITFGPTRTSGKTSYLFWVRVVQSNHIFTSEKIFKVVLQLKALLALVQISYSLPDHLFFSWLTCFENIFSNLKVAPGFNPAIVGKGILTHFIKHLKEDHLWKMMSLIGEWASTQFGIDLLDNNLIMAWVWCDQLMPCTLEIFLYWITYLSF